MKTGVALESTNPQISFTHYALRTLIGSNYKNGTAELVFKVLAEIQVIGMLVGFSFKVLSNNSTDSLGIFADKISKYCSFGHLFTFEEESSLNNFLYGLFFVYLLFVMIVMGLLVNKYYTRNRDRPTLLYIWKNVGVFHHTVAFLLIYQFMLSLTKTAFNEKFFLWVADFPIPFFVVGCVSLVITTSFAILFCKFLYEPLKTNYLCAARTSSMDMLILLYKILDPLLDLFLTDQDMRKWLRAVLNMLIFVLRLKVFIMNIPYFYKTPMKLFQRFAFAEFALSFVNFIMVILGETANTNSFAIVYVGAIFTAFFPKISDVILEKRIRRYASKDIDSMRNSHDFHWRLFALEAVFTEGAVISKAQKRSRDYDYEFLLYGAISAHKKRCSKGGCGCRIILKQNDSNQNQNQKAANFKEKEIFQGLKFELLKELFREGQKRMPFDTEIKIGLANIIFENKYRSYAPSISLIHTMELAEQSIIKRVIAIGLLEKIEKKLVSDYDSSVNIKEVVDYQSASLKLRALIESNIAKFLTFWETYKAPDPSVVKLYSCSESLNQEADEISVIWNTIIRKYKKLAYGDHLIYGLYLSLVRSAPHSAEKALQTYFSYINSYDPERNRESLLTPDNVHEAKNVLVCITMKREKLGTVAFITSNIEDLIQCKQSEIVGKDVNVMMPAFYQERHKRILLAHVENSRTTIFNRNRQVFIQKKDGYILPCMIYITMFPYFQGQLLYMGVLRPTSIYDDFILVLSDGTIDCFTENIGKALNLNAHHNRKYNLLDISKELAKLHRALLSFGGTTELKWKSSFTKKRSGVGYIDSSYSIRSQTTQRDKEGRSDEIKDDPEDEQHDIGSRTTLRYNSVDLVKTYDLFTSTGVTINFYKNGGLKGDNQKLEYNTLITEEHILGSHLRIFRLQTTSAAGDVVTERKTSQNDLDEQAQMESFIEKKKTHTRPVSEYSASQKTIPNDPGIRIITEEDLTFKNPFEKKSTTEVGSSTPEANSKGMSQKNSEQQIDQAPVQIKSFAKHKTMVNHGPDEATPMTSNSMLLKKGFSSKDKNLAVDEDSVKEVPEKNKKLEKGQLKKFLKENQIIVGEDGVDKNSVASQTRTDKINGKLERAIYLNETEFSIKILTYAIICFCGLSVAMVIYFHIATQLHLSNIDNNVNILELTYERSNQIIEIDRKARMIYIFQKNLAPVVRHTSNDLLENQQSLLSTAGDLAIYNNDIRNSVHKVDSEVQDKFYEMNNIFSKENPNKIRRMNTFDVTTELVTSALEIYNLLSDSPDANDPNLQFILNNSLKDVLIKNDDIDTLLSDRNSDSMQSIEDTVIAIIIIRVTCGFMIFIFVIRIEVSFLRMRSRLLEAFLTIKDYEVEQSVYIVNTFYSYIRENRKGDYFLEKIANSKNSQGKLASHKKLQNNKGFKAKKASLHGINMPILLNLVFTCICLSVFVILLSILLRIYAINRELIDNSRSHAIDARGNLFRFSLVFTSLYEYIAENEGTVVGNVSISQELQVNFDYLSAANNYLATFIDEGSTYNDEIAYLLRGDLCSELFKDQICYTESSGVISKGLLAMNDQMLKAIKSVKDFYDSSSKTTDAEIEQAQQRALIMRDLIAAEKLFNNFMKKAYVQLNLVLIQQYSSITSTFSNTNLAFLIFAVVTCLTLTKFLFMLVRTRMENERKGYQNFMRIIPVVIIMNNRFLKNYLMTNSKKLLESIKNRL